MSKTIFIAGTFDDNGGKRSKIGDIIYRAVADCQTDTNSFNPVYVNGGSFNELEKIVESVDKGISTIYWFPNIDNGKPKLVNRLKENFKGVLITSKNNYSWEYSFEDLVSHALRNKSNLFVEFIKKGQAYSARVADPLGNVYLDFTEDFHVVGNVLCRRVDELKQYSRVPSTAIAGSQEIPDDESFFQAVRRCAEIFHELIHPKTSTRFLGNASFRCESGFPAFRKDRWIFVSARDLDKRGITRNNFVPVRLDSPPQCVNYIGKSKPSVDAPINLGLYNHFPSIRYSIHGHVYIKDAKFTKNIVPCGAIDEVEEITSLIDDRNCEFAAVNLRGHGSIVLSSDSRYFEEIVYVKRPVPEYHPPAIIDLSARSKENLSEGSK